MSYFKIRHKLNFQNFIHLTQITPGADKQIEAFACKKPRFKIFNFTLSIRGNTYSILLPLAEVLELASGIPLPSVSV